MLVYCHLIDDVEPYPYRLPLPASEYVESNETVDFNEATTINELIGMLEDLHERGMHLVGSRDYVYHSGRMAKEIQGMLSAPITFDITALTRTGGLRQRFIQLVSQ